VARLGGDEFAVVMSCSDEAECLVRAEEIAAALDRSFDIEDLSVHATASVGVAFWPNHAGDVEGLLRHADVAMYAAKKNGGQVSLYDPDKDNSSVRRVQLLGALREAGDRGEFQLWAQPIVDARTLDVIDLETLIRWEHPELGWVYPDEFIELAEVSGAIRSVTRFVVDRAIDMGHELSRRGIDVGVSCNVSARNLYESDFASWMASVVEKKGRPSGGFTIELTETGLMDDVAQAVAVMDQMIELGIDVWMDDFGTGYSSLAQLRSLPMKAIKIDRGFVSRITRSEEDATIVRWIVDLGHGLGLPVIAEGVEDLETLDALVGFGCDAVQGYLFARPMRFDYVLDLLESTGASFGPARQRVNESG
jgi:predicted signal transduction protein with EAL and GGDEF domain